MKMRQTPTVYNVRTRNFEIKKAITKGICHIIEDGKTCKNKTKGRGVCSGHLSYFKRNDILKKYGTPPLKTAVRKFKINKTPDNKNCRLIDEGKACKNTVRSRGVCNGHAEYLKSHDLFEKFALTPVKDKIRTFKIKKKSPKGICHIIDNKKRCTHKVNARGLCNGHTDYFKRHGLFKKYASPSKKKSAKPNPTKKPQKSTQ